MKNKDTNQMLKNYVSLLKAETGLFSAFSVLLEKLRVLVKKRDWQVLEKTVEALDSTGGEIIKLENTRHSAFCVLKEKYGLLPDAPLKMLSPHLGDGWDREITNHSVKLKLEVMKVQTQAKSLNGYIHSVSGFLTRFFEELYPHTKGKIYSRKGMAKENSENPYIVNKQL